MPLTLLHPALFLLGLACVSIPIVLHLLKRKRRPVAWGAMRFLEEAYRKRRRIITLEQLVLLALRCLLVLLIALGVGSLMLGSGLARSVPTTMVIVLDDSIGSALVVDGVSELDRSKALALAALGELDAAGGDQAVLISASRPAMGLVLPESNDLGAVRALIESRTPTDAGADLGGAIALAHEIGTDPQRPARRVMLVAGSGRGGTHASSTDDAPPSRVVVDELLIARPDQQKVTNTGISGLTPTRSLVTATGITLPMGVRVDLVRTGDTGVAGQSRVSVTDHKGRALGERTVRWDAGQTSVSAVVAIDPTRIEGIGARAGLLIVSIDADANERDNTRMATIPLRRQITVGVIDRGATQGASPGGPRPIEASRWVRAALAPGGAAGIEIVSIEASRAGALVNEGLDALFVLAPDAVDEAGWARIGALHASGALLVVTPDADSSSSSWVDRVRALDPTLLSAGAGVVGHEPALGLDAQIPGAGLLGGIASEAGALGAAVSVSRSLTLGTGARAIATLSDGSALGVQSQPGPGEGMIVVLGVALDLGWTNLPARPLFVAMMQEIVRQGVGIGSSMPDLVAGDAADAPAWARSSRRVALQGSTPTRADPGGDNPRISGVIARLDAQGVTRQLTVINPDASGANADTVSQETLGAIIEERIEAGRTRWVARDPGLGQNATGPERALLEARTPSVSIALWMLLAAGVVAVIELVLARLFTARLLGREIAGGQLGSRLEGTGGGGS